MKLILLEDVRSVGRKGQIVDVSDGYAKNFLLPKKLAAEATKANINEIELKKKSEQKRRSDELERAKELAASLNNKTIKATVKAGEGGRLFGSVTNKEIAAFLEEQTGVSIDRKKIVLSEPIKAVGVVPVQIKIFEGINAVINLDIQGV